MNDQYQSRDCPICCSSGLFERRLPGGDLSRCQACNFVYANVDVAMALQRNSALDESTVLHYQGQQSVLDQAFYYSIVGIVSREIGATSRSETRRVLDIGCGHGMLLSHYKANGWECHGIDSSPYATVAARRIGFNLVSGFIESNTLPSDQFDAVVSTSTFEHIPEPRQHILAALRVLKPGGMAVFAGMPNYGSLPIRFGCSSFRSNMPPIHVNYFTVDSLRKLMELPAIARSVNGFRVICYGVAGAWELYAFVLRQSRRLLSVTRHLNMSSGRQEFPVQSIDGVLPPLWARGAVSIYQILGRPFAMGASLMLVFRKNVDGSYSADSA